MAVFLPQLEEDEALFGPVSRYGAQMRVANWKGFVGELFGYNPRLHAAGFQNLEYLADQTSVCWGKSAAALIEGWTLIPYLLRFKDECTATAIRQTALRISHGDAPLTNQYMRGWRKTLRYCAACVADDLAAGRRPYWRRWHHLPCAIVCEKHGARLNEHAYRDAWLTRWPCPDSLDSAAVLPPIVSSTYPPIWKTAAEISRTVLKTGWADIVGGASPHDWRQILEVHFSLGSEAGRADLRWAFEVSFGKEALCALDVPLSSSRDWLTGRLEGRYRTMAPLVDVLIASFCRALQPWDPRTAWPSCIGVCGIHGAEHAVGWITRAGGRYRVACICGSRFSLPTTPRYGRMSP